MIPNQNIVVNDDLIVNEVVRIWPASLPVFRQFGIDTCCGGNVTLRAAANRAGITTERLISRIQCAVAGERDRA